MRKQEPNPKLQAWTDARRRHRLTHAQVQMARELGMSPKNLTGLDNHAQEPWKVPPRRFIESLYFERFGKERPDTVLSIEQRQRQSEQKAAARRERKKQVREQAEANTKNRTAPAEGTSGRRACGPEQDVRDDAPESPGTSPSYRPDRREL